MLSDVGDVCVAEDSGESKPIIIVQCSLFWTFLLNLFKEYLYFYCIFSGVVAEVCMAEERADIDCPLFYLPDLYIYS